MLFHLVETNTVYEIIEVRESCVWWGSPSTVGLFLQYNWIMLLQHEPNTWLSAAHGRRSSLSWSQRCTTDRQPLSPRGILSVTLQDVNRTHINIFIFTLLSNVSVSSYVKVSCRVRRPCGDPCVPYANKYIHDGIRLKATASIFKDSLKPKIDWLID